MCLIHMLHIMGPLPRVASYHGLGPALDPVLAQGPIVRGLVGCHHYVVQHGDQGVDLGGLLIRPIRPGDLITAYGFFSFHRCELTFLKWEWEIQKNE